MFVDIVFPKNNETEFIEMAKELGYGGLCFCYELSKFPKKLELDSFLSDSDGRVKLFSGVVVSSDKVLKGAKLADIVLVKSSDSDQQLFEQGKIHSIFDLELKSKKDSLHFRKSGLNQVLSRLAKKKDISITLSLSSLLNCSGMLRSQLIGRMAVNIRLARKFKFNLAFASFADKPYHMRSVSDLVALVESFGAHHSEAKKALENVYNLIQSNLKKKSPNYLGEGIELVE